MKVCFKNVYDYLKYLVSYFQFEIIAIPTSKIRVASGGMAGGLPAAP